MRIGEVGSLRESWSFHNPVRVEFGRGCRARLLELLRGRSILVVTTQRGRHQLVTDRILGALAHQCSLHWVDEVSENPDVLFLQGELDKHKHLTFDAVLAFGGGSSIDAAKVLNVALHKECKSYSISELLHKPALYEGIVPAPLYAVPTTAGTGSEVTPFATVWDKAQCKKFSMTGRSMFPAEALVDPELSESMPTEVTLSTGLDAINQAAESIWNRNANSITFGYATRALALGMNALPRLIRGDGGNGERDCMAEASLLAGLAISHTRTALCHSISYPLTARFGVSHGLACAFTMPAVLRLNIPVDDGRFGYLSMVLTGQKDFCELVEFFDHLYVALNVREKVRKAVGSLDALLALKDEMLTPGRADNNLNPSINLEGVLRESWGSE